MLRSWSFLAGFLIHRAGHATKLPQQRDHVFSGHKIVVYCILSTPTSNPSHLRRLRQRPSRPRTTHPFRPRLRRRRRPPPPLPAINPRPPTRRRRPPRRRLPPITPRPPPRPRLRPTTTPLRPRPPNTPRRRRRRRRRRPPPPRTPTLTLTLTPTFKNQHTIVKIQ